MDCIYTFNPVGALIWETLNGGTTLVALEQAIVEMFDADPQVVAADLREFLAELESAGAVRKV